MTVPAGQTPIISYAYEGAGDYTFSFRVFSADNLALTMLDTDGVRTPLTLGVDFTVSLIDEGLTGGTCHLTSSETGVLEIRRVLSREQPTDWVNNSAFNTELLELDLDRAIMIVQEMQVLLDDEYVSTNWKGDWVGGARYSVRELVTAPNNNWYSCAVAHIASASFTDDLESGYWVLALETTVASHSIPAGGTTGQRLVKSTDMDYETEWETIPPVDRLVGEIIMWPFDTPPTGYLPVGTTYNYDDYPELGALFGSSAGNTFDVPAINFAKNSGGVNTGNVESESVGTHGHVADEVPDHGHTASTNSTGSHAHSVGAGSSATVESGGHLVANDGSYATGYAGLHSHSVNVADGGAHTPVIQDHSGTTQPECTLLNFVIRA